MKFKRYGAVALSCLMTGLVVVLFLVTAGSGPETANAQENKAAAAVQSAAAALPNAQPGECYAKVFVPSEYKTVTEEVVTSEASEKIEIVPAKWEWVEEKVLIKPASSKLVVVPAAFEKAQERVEIKPGHTEWRNGTGAKAVVADPSLSAAARALGIPASAKPGECYAEYLIAPEYKTETVKVQVHDAFEKLEIIPAKFAASEERVVVKEAAQKVVEEPAIFETTQEKILVKPAYTTWKTGTRPVEQIENAAGEIMCFVEVPAEYQTVSKRVLKNPAKSTKVEIPAEYQTLPTQKLVAAAEAKRAPVTAQFKEIEKRTLVTDAKITWRLKGSPGPGKATGRVLCMAEVPAEYTSVPKQVIKQAAATKEVAIPAEYQTIRVRKLVSPASEKRTSIPAKTEVVTKRVKISDGKLEWRPVLCEVNMSKNVVLGIQRALKSAGLNPGPIDGVIGTQTMVAVNAFQRSKGLATGGLTMDTIKALGVKIGS